jgi:hypothetical protein
MTSFKFPPPPPPPPKASSNDDQQSYPSQRGGYSRGRGDGGRGRGGNQRGGAGGFGGHSRGGLGNTHRGGQTGGYQNNRGGPSRRGGSAQWQQSGLPIQTNISNAPNMATQAYPNPSFTNPPPVDPNTLVQAMSFTATPAGAQSMAAFASHMASAGSPIHSQQPPQYSPKQPSGQKRKWDDRQNNAHTQTQPQQKPQQQSSKPPRAKAAVPPAVPGFGFTLPAPSAPVPSKSHRAQDNRKGKVRLGLTQNDEKTEGSSEDEDIDEEAALGEKLKGGGYAFEHEGEHISLQTAGDIAEWIKDRRRNFPTYQKAVEKAQAKAEKRTNELEFVRRLKGKPPQSENERAIPAPKVHERSKRDEKKQEELAALRKKLHESMMKKKKETPATVDLGIGYGSATASEEESSVLSESSVVSSSEESSEDSDEEIDDSDAPPEATSSKMAPPPINIPPPPKPSQTERRPGKAKMCPNWRQHGKCPFGDGCRFKHPPLKEEKRKGLYEKLVEQELVKSDQVALDAIKYLGQNGFLG